MCDRIHLIGRILSARLLTAGVWGVSTITESRIGTMNLGVAASRQSAAIWLFRWQECGALPRRRYGGGPPSHRDSEILRTASVRFRTRSFL